ATRAAAAGYRVSALGLGTARGASWRHPRGDILQARLDAGSLQALARAGNGGYAPLAADASDLAELGVLVPRDVDPGAGGESGMLAWQDQGYWLLLPLLLLAPLGFRRGSTLAVLLACALLLPWQPAHAADGGWWLREDQQRHARMERGSEAYRAGDFAAAAEAWRGLPDADAAYNLGNALAKQGRYRDAIAAYDEALRRRPGMEDAIANRQAVVAAVQRQRPSGGQSWPSRSSEGEGEGQDKGSGDQGGETDAGDEAAQGEGRSSAGKQNEEAPEAGARPADAGAQRESDAAQRERMQRALQEGAAEGAGSEAQAPEAGETTAEHERRLATRVGCCASASGWNACNASGRDDEGHACRLPVRVAGLAAGAGGAAGAGAAGARVARPRPHRARRDRDPQHRSRGRDRAAAGLRAVAARLRPEREYQPAQLRAGQRAQRGAQPVRGRVAAAARGRDRHPGARGGRHAHAA